MENFWSDERFTKLVQRQHGRLTWAQLAALGVSRSTASQWTSQGRLTRVMPHVYAVGPVVASFEARLWEAVLYAGPGAMLSHRSAAHWRGLIDHPPAVLEVSTRRPKARSITGIVRVGAGRDVGRALLRGLPVTTVPQTVLDLAGVEPALVQRALAVLDYRKQLNIEQLIAACGSGRRGSSALRLALENHLPELAHTNGKFEERFLLWCVRYKVPLARFNVWVHGCLVDAHWAEQGLVVELDGYRHHSSRAQMHRDRSNELSLRSYGLRVVRYDWKLMRTRAAEVRADLMRHLGTES